jgi:F-type H+-transporting ATPase subunit delta|tara:strand:+ start:3492 stop:4025 length:534 start_codon:yes stop_codon:yes gene_type:complete
MKNSKTANRYAKALLELSLEKGNLDAVNGNMQVLSDTINESADLRSLIKNPTVKEEEKNTIFTAFFGKTFDADTMNFISLLTKNKRTEILPEVTQQFITQYRANKNIVTAEVTSATELDEEQKKSIIALLKHDGEVEMVEMINPALIGGFIVKVGDKQIDASIATKFKNLRKEISLN